MLHETTSCVQNLLKLMKNTYVWSKKNLIGLKLIKTPQLYCTFRNAMRVRGGGGGLHTYIKKNNLNLTGGY